MDFTYCLPVNSAMLGRTLTEFQDSTVITMEVMGCQVHAIGKAIRPLFADPVTNAFSM